ncbi:hypothetical protein S83_009987 [Arachis hypogaea]
MSSFIIGMSIKAWNHELSLGIDSASIRSIFPQVQLQASSDSLELLLLPSVALLLPWKTLPQPLNLYLRLK